VTLLLHLSYYEPVKVKLQWCLCLINKVPWHGDLLGRGGIARPFLTSATDEDEWSVSHPGRFIPWERTPGIHWIGDRVGPRACLDPVE
jgi:hypothetical protein